ncbi:MAG: O-antigen ligase family protein [Kiritimatiellae bacterium]|nr:O-antigen ligase family protein [Kiritimatiellia bacterium]
MHDPEAEFWDDEPRHRRKDGWFCRIWGAIALLLLFWPASGGMYLLASTRVWSWAIGLVLAFAGCGMVFLRPVLFPRGGFAWRIPATWCAFAALALYVAAVCPRAPVPAAARWDLLKWGCLCMAALAWIQVAGRGEAWKFWAFLLLLALSVECFYAMSRQIDHSRAVLWMQRSDQYGLRASGTYLCPNHLANALAMGFSLAFALLVAPGAGAPLRLMAVYYLAAAAPVLYWTQSRSGWGGMLAGLSATALLLAWRRGARWLGIALVAIPLALAALGFGAWKCLPAVRERIGAVLEDPVRAGGIRAKMWADTPAMVRDRPWCGHGGGSFVWTYPPYRVHTDQNLTYDYLHNDPLQTLVEYGGAGAALAGTLYLWAFALFAVRAVRSRDAGTAFLSAAAAGALAASALHSLFDFNFHIFPNPHILVMVCGLALGRAAAREGAGWAPGGRAARAVLSVLAAAACGAGLWFSLAGGISYVWTLKGEAARNSLEYGPAEAAYRRAIRWDSSNWQPWLGLGTLKATQASLYRAPDPALQAAGRRERADAAIEALSEAARLNPCDMEVEYALARAENAAGNAEAALAHCRRAAEYQCRHTFFREQLGLQLVRMGREEEALAVFRACIADKASSEVSRLNVRRLERRAAKRAAAAGQ